MGMYMRLSLGGSRVCGVTHIELGPYGASQSHYGSYMDYCEAHSRLLTGSQCIWGAHSVFGGLIVHGSKRDQRRIMSS